MRYVYHPEIIGLLQGGAMQRSATETEPIFVTPDRSAQLLQGDAQTLLSMMPAGSFDFIFADPPYFLSSGGITCASGRSVCVDKGAWDKTRSYEQQLLFTQGWLTEARRLLSENGTICVSGTLHNIYCVGSVLQQLGFKILNDIIWQKPDPPPNLTGCYVTHSSETILWARRSATGRHVYNSGEASALNGGRPLESVWTMIRPPSRWEKRHGKHPTQKPEALLERLILIFTRPGDHVLDPFCGSGTTGVVCLRRGRRFVGVDQNATFLRIGACRIADELCH